jgi:hypothetical protein
MMVFLQNCRLERLSEKISAAVTTSHLQLFVIFSKLFQLAMQLTQRLAERCSARDGFL